jgi:hypothetical protein
MASTREGRTFEIVWKSGKVETIVANGVRPANYDFNKDDPRSHIPHIQFFDSNYRLLRSIDYSVIESVTFIPADAPKTFTARIDFHEVEIERRWLDRAKYLIKLYTSNSAEPVRTLIRELNMVPNSTNLPYVLMQLALNEIRQEKSSAAAAEKNNCCCGRCVWQIKDSKMA